ncbi:hypothetical protein QWJ34_01565 [Saccharibacillus sp. CPCC 101409]|uniref:hypothetical protein n=1 Tax=Saccharibacillus sp. CPCC 101409 TaxID=3058041 RepID=UPI002671A87B|nr:hypothetical protein [Saccharibacillus sp. CPCC 101409]MDO3408447.1 hypothetical protein [Saccharibacillus sp. CPCC 101409]
MKTEKAPQGIFASAELSDEALGGLALEEDPLFGRIPPSAYAYYVACSLEFGREAARPLRGRSPRELLEEEGIEIRFEAQSGQMFGSALRAQIDWTGRTPFVTVYRDSMDRLAEAAAALGASARGLRTPDDLAAVHLAHEYYHWLEYRAGDFTADRLEKVEALRLGPIRRRAAVRQSGEIAAHAFAKELLGLPFLPNVLDYLYLLQSGTLNKEVFTEKLGKWTAALCGQDRRML